MRTTLNLPDEIVLEAKRRALEERTTLTELIVQGLSQRLARTRSRGGLPVSTAAGGLCPGVTWEKLASSERDEQAHR